MLDPIPQREGHFDVLLGVLEHLLVEAVEAACVVILHDTEAQPISLEGVGSVQVLRQGVTGLTSDHVLVEEVGPDQPTGDHRVEVAGVFQSIPPPQSFLECREVKAEDVVTDKHVRFIEATCQFLTLVQLSCEAFAGVDADSGDDEQVVRPFEARKETAGLDVEDVTLHGYLVG